MQEHSDNTRPTRLAPWLRKRLPAGGAAELRHMLHELGLATVCTEAHCPNQGECHARGTATFLIMGQQCTRQCRFCAVTKGTPLPLRDDEPQAVAEACSRMGLKYVVITSVTRDDLPDGGAAHFARTITAIRDRLPQTLIEVLTPDFLGATEHLDIVLAAQPDVFDHNVETVPRLYESVRPQSARGIAPDYQRSLKVLEYARSVALRGDQGQPRRALRVKSGLMLGVGETADEIEQTLQDLRAAGVDILTLGQYLAPSQQHWPVARYVEPAEFEQWEVRAREIGFPSVLSGPFVRSSYHAESVFDK